MSGVGLKVTAVPRRFGADADFLELALGMPREKLHREKLAICVRSSTRTVIGQGVDHRDPPVQTARGSTNSPGEFAPAFSVQR